MGSATPPSPVHGLDWNIGIRSYYPIWTVEPSASVMENICRRHLPLHPSSTCQISLLGKGARNIAYRVETSLGAYVMRVALPLDPMKVASEVATMDFVRSHTSIPVPEVYAFDTGNDNELGFPWILMDLAGGHALSESWFEMTFERKEKIIAQIATYQSQLGRHTFSAIGSLVKTQHGFDIGRITSDKYRLIGQAYVSEATLGPHPNSSIWLLERTRQLLRRLESKVDVPAEDDFGVQDRRNILRLLKHVAPNCEAILSFLPGCYSTKAESTTLYHSDLHLGNIFIDSDDNITAIIDWEFLIAVPSWASHSYPNLIYTQKRRKEPLQSDYPDTPELYLEDLVQYHCTKLRKFYRAEMDRLSPGWSRLYEDTKFHRVLDDYINMEGIIFHPDSFSDWLKAYQGDGKVPQIVSDVIDWPMAEEDTLCLDERDDGESEVDDTEVQDSEQDGVGSEALVAHQAERLVKAEEQGRT